MAEKFVTAAVREGIYVEEGLREFIKSDERRHKCYNSSGS